LRRSAEGWIAEEEVAALQSMWRVREEGERKVEDKK
jgi:hypothetical protein